MIVAIAHAGPAIVDDKEIIFIQFLIFYRKKDY